MKLEPRYRVTFTTPESWSVTREGSDGAEGRSFLIAEGRAEGRLSARYRAANFPRRRVDGALEPEFRGVLETDDGASILFHWEGLAALTDTGMRQLLGTMQHVSDDDRYRWLNDPVCGRRRGPPRKRRFGLRCRPRCVVDDVGTDREVNMARTSRDPDEDP